MIIPIIYLPSLSLFFSFSSLILLWSIQYVTIFSIWHSFHSTSFWIMKMIFSNQMKINVNLHINAQIKQKLQFYHSGSGFPSNFAPAGATIFKGLHLKLMWIFLVLLFGYIAYIEFCPCMNFTENISEIWYICFFL